MKKSLNSQILSHVRRMPFYDNLVVKCMYDQQIYGLFKFVSIFTRQSINPAAQRKIWAATALILFSALTAVAQQNDSKLPVVVQPGAPGEPTRLLPSETKGTLPPKSPKDAEFMHGMIMHHGQAVEMTALINSRTKNKNLRLIGARISQSQSDEINFMKRWLETRGEKSSPPMSEMSEMSMPGMDMSNHHQSMLMPGMLTSAQMNALRKNKGAAFDQLFLSGMIQHHKGALTMVEDLFATTGAGQDAELFNFATDVDSGQRAEIRIMQNLLNEKSVEEK